MIPNPYPGIFIVFEGIDGCGKTAQLERTRAWLNSFTVPGHSLSFVIETHKFLVKVAKEPGKERFYGKKIYADLDPKNSNALRLHKVNPHGFQTWYACDSKENLRENIIPVLKVGSVILCDRFRPSMVYGAKGPGEISDLMAMNRQIIGEDFIWPDLILIFDLAVNTAIKRLKHKNRDLDEHEKHGVLNRVRHNYLHFAAMHLSCKIINAEESEELVFEKVKNLILPLIESRKGLHIL